VRLPEERGRRVVTGDPAVDQLLSLGVVDAAARKANQGNGAHPGSLFPFKTSPAFRAKLARYLNLI
jgi:hypothetical protein